jgi:hypothetical protein
LPKEIQEISATKIRKEMGLWTLTLHF